MARSIAWSFALLLDRPAWPAPRCAAPSRPGRRRGARPGTGAATPRPRLRRSGGRAGARVPARSAGVAGGRGTNSPAGGAELRPAGCSYHSFEVCSELIRPMVGRRADRRPVPGHGQPSAGQPPPTVEDSRQTSVSVRMSRPAGRPRIDAVDPEGPGAARAQGSSEHEHRNDDPAHPDHHPTKKSLIGGCCRSSAEGSRRVHPPAGRMHCGRSGELASLASIDWLAASWPATTSSVGVSSDSFPKALPGNLSRSFWASDPCSFSALSGAHDRRRAKGHRVGRTVRPHPRGCRCQLRTRSPTACRCWSSTIRWRSRGCPPCATRARTTRRSGRRCAS